MGRIIYKIYKYLADLFNYKYNQLILKRHNVKYKTFLTIKGRILVSNKGELNLGEGVTLNCATNSNPVGLNKTCTLVIQDNAILEIGDHSGLSGVSINCSKKIVIGNYVNVGGNVSIWDTDFHPIDFMARRIHDKEKIVSLSICIEDDVFVGANSIILKGVSIGARSVIGAGSVVTRSIPSDQIWAGNPAIFVRHISANISISK